MWRKVAWDRLLSRVGKNCDLETVAGGSIKWGAREVDLKKGCFHPSDSFTEEILRGGNA